MIGAAAATRKYPASKQHRQAARKQAAASLHELAFAASHHMTFFSYLGPRFKLFSLLADLATKPSPPYVTEKINKK